MTTTEVAEGDNGMGKVCAVCAAKESVEGQRGPYTKGRLDSRYKLPISYARQAADLLVALLQ